MLLTRTPLYLRGLLPAFSFDLHVLGAPPALILSRDQTLIDINEFLIASVYSETDECFFTASNQIVNDLRSIPAPSFDVTDTGRPRNSFEQPRPNTDAGHPQNYKF